MRASPLGKFPAALFGSTLMLGWISPAAANTATASMEVSLHVTSNCVVAAGPMAFGSVSASEAQGKQAASTIEVTCTEAVPFSVSMDDGMNASAGSRRAVDPATGNFVSYEIYADAAHTRRWGQPTTVTGAATASGSTRLAAYGKVSSNTVVEAGDYRDVVTVAIDF